MSFKPRPSRLRLSFNEEEAREIHDRLCGQWVGQDHTLTFVKMLGAWLKSRPRPNPKQLELPLEK